MKKLLARHEFFVLMAILILSIIITSINPSFFSLENLFDLLRNYTMMGVFAVGVLFVLISGGIDISFTAIATVSGYGIAVLLLKFGQNMNIVEVFLIAGAIGVLLGAINACIIYFFKIPSIIATIATLNIYYGLLTFASSGKWLYGFPEWFGKISGANVFTLTTGSGQVYGFSVVTLLWFLLMIGGWLILRFTILGRSIYALGGNPASAERAGLNIFHLQLFVYSFMGLMAGFGSVIQALLVQTVAPNSLVGKELDVIAAVVLGGASLTGGTGSMLGTLLGLALIAILGNGLTLMHVPAIWYKVILGFVILVSVGASTYRNRARHKKMVIIEGE